MQINKNQNHWQISALKISFWNFKKEKAFCLMNDLVSIFFRFRFWFYFLRFIFSQSSDFGARAKRKCWWKGSIACSFFEFRFSLYRVWVLYRSFSYSSWMFWPLVDFKQIYQRLSIIKKIENMILKWEKCFLIIYIISRNNFDSKSFEPLAAFCFRCRQPKGNRKANKNESIMKR